MTKIDEMPAGREMDALVAEKVMGLEWRSHKPYCAPEGWYPRDAPACNERDERNYAINAEGYKPDLPMYSFDIAAAWEVVEKLTVSHQLVLESDVNGRAWAADFKDDPLHTTLSCTDTAPLAICRAALKAADHDT